MARSVSPSGGRGVDRLFGGLGNDVIRGFDGSDLLNGGDGIDRLFGSHGNDRIIGGAGHDFISGDDGNDTLFGLEGADVIQGGNGTDIIFGGEGNDRLYGDLIPASNNSRDDKKDRLRGNAGQDQFFIASPDLILDFNELEDSIEELD